MNEKQDIVIPKIDILRGILSQYDFGNASVLDAGTGKTSAQLLANMKPKTLVCVTLEGDLRKGESVKRILDSQNNKGHVLLYGDLANETLFNEGSFDFILADYLVGELAVDKVLRVFKNLFKFLKPEGQVLLVDREFCPGFVPRFRYLSMGKIKGSTELEKRSDRDLVEVANLFLTIPRELLLLSETERSFDFPSYWVSLWLEDVGFQVLEVSYFDSKVNTESEFRSRVEWAKQRIKNIKNSKLRKGLIEELEKVVIEYDVRKIAKSDFFLRKQFLIRAARSTR
jgi:SAM-dependent methyltransferase